jgi:hypothetical protein
MEGKEIKTDESGARKIAGISISGTSMLPNSLFGNTQYSIFW